MVSKLQSYDSSLKCQDIFCLSEIDVSLHSIRLKRSKDAAGNKSFSWLVLASSKSSVSLSALHIRLSIIKET